MAPAIRASKSASGRALVGVFGEQPQRVGEHGAGGLVAGHHEQDEEGADLAWAQSLAVWVGVDQRGDQVRSGVADALLAQLAHQPGQLAAGGQQPQGDPGDVSGRRRAVVKQVVAADPGELGVVEAEDGVGVAQHRLVVVRGDAHHVADDLDGQPGRDLRDEISAAAGDHVVHDAPGPGL
jgi:hypothetical protein